MVYQSKPNWKGVGHPKHDLFKYTKGATTTIGKFRRQLGCFTREYVPPDLLELFDFYKGMNTREINYVLELANLYKVVQKAMLPTLVDKITHGENLNKTEIDALRLLKDTLVESHKLKYGEHKVIERIVTANDLRKQIFYPDKKIVDVEDISKEKEENLNEPVSQDLDRSGCGEEQSEDKTDIENSGSTPES